jgi:fibronectin-binding autotransporter adhesin
LVLGDGTTNTGTLGGNSSVNDNGSLVFNEPTAVTIGDIIGGTGTVTISGPGPVTFTDGNNNSYSGGTTIAAGSKLTLGDGTSNTGSVGSGNVTNNGALIFNEPSAVTIANNISGTGSVTQQDMPMPTLVGSNSYTGGTTIIGDNNGSTFNQRNGFGDLELATTGALPNYAQSPIGTITLQTAGGLVADYALDQTTLNAISTSSVGFVALGANSANNLDFTNLPRVSLGAEGLGVTQTFSGTLTPTTPGGTSLSPVNYQYQVGGGNGFLSITSGLADPAQGLAELDAVNNGFTILQGFNTFTGGMNVTLGVVELGGPSSYCSLTSDCGGQQDTLPIQVAQTGVLATGYALDQNTLNSVASSSNGTVALGNDSSNNLDFTDLPNVSLGAVGNYTYSGTITPGINGYLLGGGGDFRVNSNITVTQLLTGANTLTVNAPGFDPGTVTLINAETYTGNSTINGGTLLLGNGTTNGTIANSPLVTITNTSESTGNLGFEEATAITFANPITGTGQVEQYGPGTVTLTQAESYTGATAIYGGTLVLAPGSSIAASFNVTLVSNASGDPAVLDISQGNDQTVHNLGSFWDGPSNSVTAQVLLGSHTLTVDTSFDNIFDGVISGTGGLVSNGPRTFTLAGINTYSGPTTISGGTLELGGQAILAPAASIGTLGSGPVVDNAALLFTEPGAVTLPNAISGTGTVTQAGPGIVTLSGTNTYSGGTTIATGTTLGLGGQATGAPSATVGTLGSGTVADSGTLLLTEPSAVTLPNLISGGGTVVQDGPGTVTLAAINTYSGGTTINAGTLALGGATIGGVGSGTVTDNGTLAFTEPSGVTFSNVISGTGSVTQSGPGTVALNVINTYSGGTTIAGGAALMLGGTSTLGTVGSGSVTDNGTLVFSEPSAVTIGNAIGGSGGVEQIGPGTVTLTSGNGYTGGTLVFGGTLALGSGGSIAGSGMVTLANVNGSGGFGVLDISAAGNQTINNLSSVWDAPSGTTGASVVLGGNTLTVNSTVATVFDGVISGSGGLIKSNTATLMLAGTNTYSGGTTISGGTLALGGQAPGAPAATVGTLGSGTVTDNANLAFTEPSAVTFGNTISGTGTVMQVGPGAVTLSATNTYSGGTGIAAGTTLGLGAATTGTLGSGGVINNGTLLLAEPGPVTLANLISGSGTVTQDGPGVVTLTAVNSYSGGTTISAGGLVLGGATVGGLGSGAVTANATLTFTEPSAVTFGNVISGSGGVVQSGPGTVALSAVNSYTGGTTIGRGATLMLGGSTVGTPGSGAVTDSGTLAFSEPSAVTFGNGISGTGRVTQDGPGTVTLSSTNSYSGGTTIAAGTLGLGGSTVGTLGSGAVTDNGTLAFTQPSAVTFTNIISGTGGVTQAGPGTVTLNSASTYTGLTEVKAGTLIVGSVEGNGATVGGSVQVDAGATLAGYGSLGVTLSDPPMLLNNGTVIPGGVSGDAPGTLTVAGNYMQSSGGNLLIAVTPTQAAKLQVGGTATLAGTITFAYAPGTYVPTTYTVVTSTGAISTRFGTVAEQGSVPTGLIRTVEYVANTPDPVLLVLSSPAVLEPAGAHIFSEQLGSLAGLADSNAATMLDGGAANDCATAGVPPAPSEPGAPAKASAGIAAIGRMLCDAGGWIHVDGTFHGVDGGGGNPSYHADTAGFLAGVDRPVGDGGLRMGIAAGYDHRWLTDSDGANATADVAQFGLYAIQPAGPVVLNAAFLYGRDWDTTNRPSGVGTATAQYGGNEFSGGARASMPMTLGGFTGVPMAGVRFASVGTGSFAETGSGSLSGFGLSGAPTSQLSVIPYARFVLTQDFIMSSGIKVSPYAAVGYQYQAGDTQQAVLLTSADGTTFRIGSTSLDRSAGTLGVGIAAGQGNWSAFASYGALVSGNWQEQEIDVGLRVSF